MRKVAIFVEGHTELIMVREFILKRYNYEVSLDCFELVGSSFRAADYEFPNPSASIFYQIICVGNDQRVSSEILSREESFFNKGFEKIIGLRDMYCEFYKEKYKEINIEFNKEILSESNLAIKERSTNNEKIFLCFSIMEIEAWFIGLFSFFEKLHPDLTLDLINNKMGIDLTKANPETDFFHPFETFTNILALKGFTYKKKKGDTESICGKITREDYEKLYASSICESFKLFYDKVA